MQRGPVRTIVTTSAVVGVLTAGVVLLVSAPSLDARGARGEAEGRWQAARFRMERDVGSGDWELIAARAAKIADEFPDKPAAWLRLAQARERLGLGAAADNAWRRLDELTAGMDDDPNQRYIELHRRGWAHRGMGRPDEARLAWLAAARQVDQNTAWGIDASVHARLYALAGWDEKALEKLETMLAIEPHHYPQIMHEPDLDPLRGDPRFMALVERVREARELRRLERERREREHAERERSRAEPADAP